MMAQHSPTPSERTGLLSPNPASSTTLADDEADLGGSLRASGVRRLRGSSIVAAIGTLIFLLTSNISLLTTIQSPIALELDAFSSVSWFTSTYLIAVTSVTPVAGRLCQIFTPGAYIFGSIVLFSIGLFVVSIAPNLSVFLLGRAITGAGAAAITPVAIILVKELTSEKRRGLFIGFVNSGYTTGVALGAIIAGALEPAVGWRGVFWLQIPLALAAGTVLLFAIPRASVASSKESEDISLAQKFARIDYLGVLTLTSAVVLLLYSLSLPKIVITPILVSLVLVVIFLIIEARFATQPVLPVSVLKSRANLLIGISTLGLMTARWTVLFYAPIYAIAVRDWSPASAGLMLLPTNGGFALGGILAGWIHIRRAGSFYISSLITYISFSVFLLIISQISTPTFNVWIYVLALFANGFSTGASLNYTLAHVLYLTTAATHILVIPLNTMFRGFAGSFGSAISGGIFARVLKSSLEAGFEKRGLSGKEKLVMQLLGTPGLVRSLAGEDREVAVSGYMTALRTLFMAGAGLAIIMTLVQAGTGWAAPKENGEYGGVEEDLSE